MSVLSGPASKEPVMAVNGNNVTVRSGRKAQVRVVTNQVPKLNASNEYVHIRADDESGNEYNLLFTWSEIARARQRANSSPEDIPSVSRSMRIFDRACQWFDGIQRRLSRRG